jgi:hypothetical protein
MPITAVPTTVAADVYAIRPRVSVSVADVASSVAYTVPAAAIDYIEIQLAVTSSTISRNPYARDTLVVLDEKVISFAKIFLELVAVGDLALVGSLTSSNTVDSTAVTDIAGKLTNKGVIDIVSSIDVLTLVIAFGQSFSDFFSVSQFVAIDTAKGVIESISATDSNTVDVSKSQSEIITVSADIASLFVNKTEEDQVTPVEQLAKAFSRTLADTVSIADVLDIFSFLGQNLFDTIEVPDTILGVSPSPGLSDAPSANDLLTLFISRVLADGVGMNDQADTTDGFEFNFSASFSNVAFLSEQKYLLLAKLFVDTFGVQDSSSVSLAKLVADQITNVDSAFINTLKQLDDNSSIEDSATKETSKQAQDAFSLLSNVNVLLAAAHYDAVTQQDELSFISSLIKIESQPVLDALFFAVEILKLDSVTPLEVLLYELSRLASDTTQVDEQIAIAPKKTLVEAIAVLEEARLAIASNFSDVLVMTEALNFGYLVEAFDGVGINDGADTTDGIAFVFTQSVSNVAFVLESSIKSTSKTVVDAISVGSTGIVVVQDYCDQSYFAGDYVGVSRNFT